MTYMDLKRDEWGRPIGLNWPERPPVEPEVLRRNVFAGEPNLAGRPRQDLCGAELHDMNEHGREIKGGSRGRYCNECKKERQRKSNARYRAKKKAA